VDKDPSVKDLAFRIRGLTEKLKNVPMVKRAGHFFVDVGGSDGDDGSDGSHDDDDGRTLAAVTDSLIDSFTMYSDSVCVFVFVRLLDMNCLVCLSIMNCLINLFGCWILYLLNSI
jgi:hypothetical protein